METKEIIIELKIRNSFIDIIRIVLCFLAIVIVIFLLPINLIATLVFLGLIFFIILFSAKSSIEIHEEFLLFNTKRMIGLLNSNLSINYKDIIRIDYYPKKTYWLIVLLPGYGGFQDTEFIFHLKNKESISKKIHNSKNITEKFTIELEKRTKLIRHQLHNNKDL